MGPAEECDDAPLEALEDGELRGPMDGYPRVSDCLACPLAQRLMQGLQARGDDVIQVYPREGVSWTARQVLQRGLQLAAGMQMLGVKPGDYVTLVGGRHPEYGPLLIATLVVGAAWAPLNHTFDDGDLRLLLGILEPRVVLAEREVADRLRPLLAELQSPSTLAVLCEGEEWAALATDAAPDTWPPLPPPPADPRGAIAVVACSSGTSGLPKACHSSHFAVFGALSIFTRDETLDGISDTMVLTSPGFWVTGIWFTLLTMVHRTRLVYEYGCDEHQFLEAIEKNRVSKWPPGPTLLFLCKLRANDGCYFSPEQEVPDLITKLGRIPRLFEGQFEQLATLISSFSWFLRLILGKCGAVP